MKILFLTSLGVSPFSGGVERFSLEIGKALHDCYNHQIVYVSLKPSKTEYNDEKYGAICRNILPNQNQINSPENEKCLKDLVAKEHVDVLFNQQSDSSAFIELCARVKLDNPAIKIVSILHFDPLHYINIYRSSIGDLFSSGLPIRTILSYAVRNISLVKWNRLKEQKKRYNFLCENSDAVVLLSKSAKASFSQIVLKKYDDKLYAISNPLTADPDEKDCQQKENVILFVGRMEFLAKRPDLMLKVWEMVSRQNESWKIIFVGDGSYLNTLKKIAEKKRMERISFVGYADSELFYKNAKILCMTSNTEGFGLVLTEASSYGVVPLSFDSFSSVYEIIEDGKTGFIIPSFNIEEYSRKLQELMNSPELLEEMSSAAKKNVERFSLSKAASAWDSLFNNLLNSN